MTKKTRLVFSLILCGLSLVGGDKAFSSLPKINSSSWQVDPNKLGMTAEEYIRAESLHFMAKMVKRKGINNFFHFTSLAKAEDKWVVSPNNDVIYSMAIVDVSKGFTLHLPDVGERFITAQIVSEEHMSTQLVGGGIYKFSPKDFNGTHVAIGVRVGTDASANDIKYIVEELQGKMTVDSKSAKAVPSYDDKTLLKVREQLMPLYNKLTDTFGLMTDSVEKVKDWERFTYVTAGAWGLSEDKYAMYLPYNLSGAKKSLCYEATYVQPIVGEFWSITAYNNEKYLMSNEFNIINSKNVKLNDDKSFTVHFCSNPGCNKKELQGNYIFVNEDDWGFLMRAYEPDVQAFQNYKIPELKELGKTTKLKVTKENYVEAETDYYFSNQQQKAPVNTFLHQAPVSIDNQVVIRSNRDVMYSLAVVDVSQGATFTVPPRKAFQIIHIMDENHLSHRVVKAGESLTLHSKDLSSGNHVYLLARTKITEDLDESLRAQKAMKIEANSSTPYRSKAYVPSEVEDFRNALTAEFIQGKVKIIEHKSFVLKIEDADPTSYIYAAAVGWGGLPSHTAQYLPSISNQGNISPQKISIPKPNLDWGNGGFFSLTTYDSDGWIVSDNFYIDHERMHDDGDAYTIFINSPKHKNSIDVKKGWTAVFRFYMPKDEKKFIQFIDSIRNIKTEKL